MPEIARRLTTILAADVAGYSRLAGADEEGTVSRLRALRQELIDPVIAANSGRTVKTTGDGRISEFASVVDAVRAALEVQRAMAVRNANIAPDRRIDFRVGIHLGDIIVESDGDLMGDGVNIAARLEGICEPGGICLSEDAFRQVRDKIDADFTDLGERELKNIARPVRAYSVSPHAISATPAKAGVHRADTATATGMDPGFRRGGKEGKEKGSAPTRRAMLVPLLGGILALILIAGGAWYFLAAPKPIAPFAANPPAQAAHLSIVVLPFANLSGDPKQDYFADGITENLTTDLSRIRNSFVIARNTAFTFKGKNIDAKEIGKELGVRYVLEGSVQRDGTRVRVNAQLIDAESGADLWADRFEEDLADLFELQDDIVARLANALGYELVKAEATKSAHSKNPDAIDLTMRGWALLNVAGRNKPQYEQARNFFEAALKLDPQDPEAMVGIALIDSRGFVYGWINNPDPTLTAQLSLVDRALTINPNYALAYYVRSYALFFARRYADSVQAAQTGVSIDPNSAYSYFALAQAEKQLGQCDQAISHMKEAFLLSPRDPASGVWHMELGIAENCVGHREAALKELRRAVDAGFRTYVAYVNLAAVAALSGDEGEAKSALRDAQRLAPELTSIRWVTSHIPTTPQVLDGLRKAGLPEDDAPKHLSIVVLPFTNLSGDPKQDYFADGITENLTTDLSRIRNSFVIARNTAFTYKGKSIDAKEIGKELGVRYVLEGSVQRDASRVRINAQLIDAESGAELWADRFDDDVADLFKLQDEVVARLANALGYQLTKAEAAIGAHTNNPDAIDLAMRGWAILNSAGRDKAKHQQARTLFDDALKLDPNDAEAMVGIAIIDTRAFVYGWNANPDPALTEPLNLIAKALSLSPNYSLAYFAKSYALAFTKRFSEAVDAAALAVTADPNSAVAHYAFALAQVPLGQCAEATRNAEQSFRLSPRDPDQAVWHFNLGQAEFCLGQYGLAIGSFRHSTELGLHSVFVYAFWAGAAARNGDDEEAKAALANALHINPRLTIKWLTTHALYFPGELDAVRKAGLPEQ